MPLPYDILEILFKKCDNKEDILNCRMVCKEWKYILYDVRLTFTWPFTGTNQKLNFLTNILIPGGIIFTMVEEWDPDVTVKKSICLYKGIKIIRHKLFKDFDSTSIIPLAFWFSDCKKKKVTVTSQHILPIKQHKYKLKDTMPYYKGPAPIKDDNIMKDLVDDMRIILFIKLMQHDRWLKAYRESMTITIELGFVSFRWGEYHFVTNALHKMFHNFNLNIINE